MTFVDGHVVRTKSCWIQDKFFYFAEGTSPVSVRDVKTVTLENPTEAEKKQHDDAVNAFRAQAQDLMKREQAVIDAVSAGLADITPPASGERMEELCPKGIKAVKKELAALQKEAGEISDTWRQARLPEFSLLLVREIKLIQLLSLKVSLEQTLRYVETGDPTALEYAKAFLAQHASFTPSLREAVPWE